MDELKKQVFENSKKIEQFEDVSQKIVTVINGYSIVELRQVLAMGVEVSRLFHFTKKYKFLWIFFFSMLIASFFGLDCQLIVKLLGLFA